jgi:hypothetical protein
LFQTYFLKEALVLLVAPFSSSNIFWRSHLGNTILDKIRRLYTDKTVEERTSHESKYV